MNPRQVAPLLLASLVSLALAPGPQTPAEILRQIAKYKQQQAEFDARWHTATGEARPQRQLA